MSFFNILRVSGGFVLPALCHRESGPNALWGDSPEKGGEG
jgi:hypothetical protein